MLLYHFTSLGHLPLILAHGGLEKGDVMIGEDGERTVNATWLSTSPDPDRQGLGPDEPIEMPSNLRQLGLPDRLETIDKRTVRIGVMIPTTDRRLRQWIRYAQGRVGQRMIDLEIKFAGGRAIAEEWFVYLGLIPASRFLRIEIMDERGEYRAATPEQIAEIEPHEVGWSFGVSNGATEH